MTASPGNRQRGGFLIGLIVGLMVGLALALGVALYVTKAPNPFVTKVPPRSPVQDAAEAERNRNWDPNAPLAGKTAMPSPPPAGPGGTSTAAGAGNAAPSAAASGPAARVAKAPTTAGSASAPPGRAAPPLSTGTGADPFTYFVQAGAYARTEDAEQQRAKLAMLGIESRLTERDQAGRTVYRVRVGPFDRKEDADRAKEKLGEAGVDSALVRVQK
jgi:cell division protein FtsN